MSRPRPILRVLSWIGCLLSGSALAQNPSPSRPDLPLDLNSDGRTDFVLSMNYSGFAPETPNKLRHLLKPSGSNQVWTVTASGQPATFDAPGEWSASNASEQQWAEAPASGFELQQYDSSGGDPRFGGGFIRRDGPLARSTPGFVDHPTPPCFVVVRFGTDAGWQLGWIQLMTFKHRNEPWSPMPFDRFPPIPPGEVRPLDMGTASTPTASTLTLGANSAWPTRALSIARVVDPGSDAPYLRLQLAPARAWEPLEMAPRIDATDWTRVPTQDGAGRVYLRNWDGSDDLSPKFFRLR